MNRRHVLQAWSAAALAAVLAPVARAAAPATANDFPTRPVRIINMFPVGGLADAVSRVMAERLSAAWNQPVIVDNRPGANGIVAVQAVLAAPADGYTLFWANDGAVSINPLLYRKLPYDPQRDLIPVSAVAETVECLIVTADLPVSNVSELVAYAKANPGRLNYGSFGPGSLGHLTGETFNHVTGAGLHHIPFKGVAEVVNGMLSGDIQVVFTGQGTPLPHIKAGKLKALAVFSQDRQPTLPGVPTAREQGLEMDARAWFGLMARAGTPPEIVERIAQTTAEVARSEEFFRLALETPGMTALGTSPQGFAEILAADARKYGEQVRLANVTLD